MIGLSRCKVHVGDNCRRRLATVLAAPVLFFAGVISCQAQSVNDSAPVYTAQQTSQPAPKPPAPQSSPGAQPAATQQAPLGSENSVGAQQPPTGTQSSPPPQPQDERLDIYGFAMLDNGYNFGTIDPNWFDVVRPVKLPSFKDEFGRNGNWFAGVRQTRPAGDESVGPLLPGIEHRIVDRDGNRVADGAVGELHVRGLNVMLGYYRAPDQTGAAIDRDGWFNTGDLARTNKEGDLYIEGRTKELIIRSGFNVRPAEVEGVLNAQAAVTRSWRCSNASRPRAAPSCSSSRTRKAPWTLPTTCI